MANVAAAIKRASAAARAAMNRFDAQTMAQLRELYQTSLDAINRAINHAADGDRVPLTALDRLRHQLDQELRRLAGERNQLLAGGLEQAAELGSQPFVAALTGDELTRINFKAVEFVKQFTANDGLQLSDRLWRVDQSAKQRIGDAIEFAIIRGDDAFRAAQRMTGEIDRDAIAAASPAKLGGNIRDLMVGRGSALYQAQRVARTELNRAHGTAYQASAENTPGCVGTRFLLSPRHPEPDICDVHATANLFGLGKGVYPPGQNPWPAHPNTLSYVVAVFEEDVTEKDREGMETMEDAEERVQTGAATMRGMDQRDELTKTHFNGRSTILGMSPRLTALGLSNTEIANLLGAPDGSRITVSDHGNESIKFRIEHEFISGASSRELQVYEGGYILSINENLSLKPQYQHQGIGARMFGTEAIGAKELGVTQIMLFAARGSKDEYNGYRTWPRYGFDAPLEEEERAVLPMDLHNITTVRELVKSPMGREWWRVKGNGRTMFFDLNDDEAWETLESYLESRGIKL